MSSQKTRSSPKTLSLTSWETFIKKNNEASGETAEILNFKLAPKFDAQGGNNISMREFVSTLKDLSLDTTPVKNDQELTDLFHFSQIIENFKMAPKLDEQVWTKFQWWIWTQHSNTVHLTPPRSKMIKNWGSYSTFPKWLKILKWRQN
jgi:hypothetical protein